MTTVTRKITVCAYCRRARDLSIYGRKVAVLGDKMPTLAVCKNTVCQQSAGRDGYKFIREYVGK